MANTIARNSDDALIKSFNLDRFENFQLVGEKALPPLDTNRL